MTGADYRKEYGIKNSENRERTAHTPLSYRVLKGLLLLLGGLLIWGLISFGVSSVPLKKVEVEGLTRYGEEEILVTSGLGTTKKMSELDRDSVKQALTSRYPYIRSVQVRYAFPLGYRVMIEEETPTYYTCIAGDYFALSADLKVLEQASSDRRFLAVGLRRITLGEVKSVMLGQTLRYDGDYLERVLKDIENSVLADRVTDVHIGDRYHLSVVCDGMYTLFLGDVSAIEAKLQLASLMMGQNDVPAGYRAILDVSDLKKTSIRMVGVQDTSFAEAE